MRFRSKNLADLAFMFFGAGAVITAMNWPLRTGLFPVIIGIPFFCMALADLLLDLFERERSGGKQSAMDFKFSEGVDQVLAFRRTVSAFIWIIVFFILILFFGFIIAVPLYVLLYLKIEGREKWGLSLILTASAWGFLYGLFVRLLHTRFQEGWVLMWLGIG